MTSSVGGGLAVVVAVVSGFVLVTVYLQRKGIGCFASKKLEVCKDPQNTPHNEDSDYATITDIMESQEYLPGPHNVDHDDGANDNCPGSKRGISVTRTSKIIEVDGYFDILDKGSSLKRKGGSCRYALTESKGSLRSRNDGTGSTYSDQIQERSGRRAFIGPCDEDEEDEDVSRLDQGLSITTSHYLCPCQDEPTSEPCILCDFSESCGEQTVTDVDGSNGSPSVRDLTYAYEKMIRSTDHEYLDLSEDQDGGYEKPVHQQGGTYLDLCAEEDRSIPPSSA
ncbi:uncharacterized protein [Haliotis cracherodii]|uniref:uncharacterized protein n=1 Tax=Haliotis cracherodii TaxID=6455 RepID=UPI0039E9A0E4